MTRRNKAVRFFKLAFVISLLVTPAHASRITYATPIRQRVDSFIPHTVYRGGVTRIVGVSCIFNNSSTPIFHLTSELNFSTTAVAAANSNGASITSVVAVNISVLENNGAVLADLSLQEVVAGADFNASI